MRYSIKVFHEDGRSEDKDIESFQDIQKVVGGYVEFFDKGASLLGFDEDGGLKGLKKNSAYPMIRGVVVEMSHDVLESIPY